MQHYIKKIKDELFELKRWTKLVISYPKLSLEKVDYDTYWKDKRGTEIGRLSDWQTERANIIVSQIKKEGLGKVKLLDIGCGDGSILNYISKEIIVDRMYGADSSSFALKRAENFGITGTLIDIGSIDSLGKLPVTNYTLLLEILEHIPNPEEVLRCVYEKTSGGIFFSFPNTGFIVYRLRLLLGKAPMQWRLHPSEHLRFWTHTDLKWWLAELGYKKYTINFYKGIPLLKKIWPALFAAAFVVYIPRS
jgi:2-polyprenyl-3-methyl-5-hydroxy-6-metoxy-1,4-benzoquinol methylase